MEGSQYCVVSNWKTVNKPMHTYKGTYGMHGLNNMANFQYIAFQNSRRMQVMHMLFVFWTWISNHKFYQCEALCVVFELTRFYVKCVLCLSAYRCVCLSVCVYLSVMFVCVITWCCLVLSINRSSAAHQIRGTNRAC